MFSDGPSGFYHAPVTQGLLTSTATLGLLASVMEGKPYLHFQVHPHMTLHHQFWRLLVSPWAFSSSGELLLGGILLYHHRLMERRFGSAKYASMLLLCTILATSLNATSLFLLSTVGFSLSLPSGPYAAIFSTLYLYHSSVPSSYHVQMGGVKFSDKTVNYFFAAQLLLLAGPFSFINATTGLLAGVIYHSDILGTRSWRIPTLIQRLTRILFSPLLTSSPPSSSRRTGATLPEDLPEFSQSDTRGNLTRDTFSASQAAVRGVIDTLRQPNVEPDNPTRPPSEEVITLMMGMFPEAGRERIVRALMENGNDPNRAVGVLLN